MHDVTWVLQAYETRTGSAVDREHTKPGLRQELHVASQNHEQVKDVPGIAEVGLGAPTGPSPQMQLKCEEGIQAQLCKAQASTSCSITNATRHVTVPNTSMGHAHRKTDTHAQRSTVHHESQQLHSRQDLCHQPSCDAAEA